MDPTPKSSKIFVCNSCDYCTSRKSQYQRHLATDKHKSLQNPTSEKFQNVVKTYDCVCGKKYKHSSTLYDHKKKCNFQPPEDNESYKDVMLMLIKDNSELKEMILEIVKNGIVNNTNNLATTLDAKLP